MRMPAIFVGHGNPMLVLSRNQYTTEWSKLGEGLAPRAILCISAHWVTRGLHVTMMDRPRTIHDFFGFPDELYNQHYNCPGSPDLAREVAQLTGAIFDYEWGLDHGAWCVLKHMFPGENIPVVQMSLDVNLDAAGHYNLGRKLLPLRDRGVLILASGNIVHNLGMVDFHGKNPPPAWALDFDAFIKDLLDRGDHQALLRYDHMGKSAYLSVPTPEHLWPLFYIAALQEPGDAITYPVEGMDLSSISMRCVRVDNAA